MAPCSKVELIYIHLSYIPAEKPGEKVYEVLARMDKPKISDFLISQDDSFALNALNILSNEIANLPNGSNVRFTEWRFVSSLHNLFVFGEFFFDKILIVLGEEMVYWTFYMHSPYGKFIQGNAPLPLSYCGCCINEQYLKILNTIKEHIVNELKEALQVN